MHSPMILIGPMKAGKSTLGKLLADELGLPQVSLDAHCYDYYREVGFTLEQRQQIRETEGLLAGYRYIEAFFPYAVERMLAEHDQGVFDLGAGHSVSEDEATFGRIQKALAPYSNIVLILPSPDLEVSSRILRERTASIEWLQEFREKAGVDMNEHFLRHPSNERLARIRVYTEGKTAEETCHEILRQVKLTPRRDQ